MITTDNFTIEPCILVRDRVTVDRAVKYHRTELGKQVNDDGSEDAKWETERHYKNRGEAMKADRVYHSVRSKLQEVCLKTGIGFVCPLSRKQELEEAVARGKQLVDEFNAEATHCHIRFLVVCTEITPANVEGVQLLRDTLNHSASSIREALQNFNPAKARDAVRASKKMVDVLSDNATKKELQEACDEAKVLCREISALVKEFDGNVQNALVSPRGTQILQRVGAAWNF